MINTLTICVALTFSFSVSLSEWLSIPIWQIQTASFCCLLACALVFGVLRSQLLTGGNFTPTSKRLMQPTLFLPALDTLFHVLGHERLKSLTCFHPSAKA